MNVVFIPLVGNVKPVESGEWSIEIFSKTAFKGKILVSMGAQSEYAIGRV